MTLSPADLLAVTVPVFALVALGMVLRQRGGLRPEADRSLLFLAVSVTYPAFILRKILGDEALHHFSNIVLPALCGAGFMLIGLGVSWLCAPLFGVRDRKRRSTFTVACSLQNYGYIPVPVLSALFPDQAWAGTLFVFTLGIELVLWTAGLMIMHGNPRTAGRQLLNPVVMSIVVGIAANFAGLDAHLPKWVYGFLDMLGVCAFPLGLIIFGTSLADLLRSPGWHKNWKTPLGAIVLRLAILPATMILLTLWLAPGDHMRHIVAVQAAMPAAMFPLVMARRYDGDEATAMQVILFTTLVSMATIPFFVPWALTWLQR
jgi:malate permease and related proteins